MKKLIPILSTVLIMTACNTTPKTGAASAPNMNQPVPATTIDTAGLAEYQAWKVEHELSNEKQFNQPADPERTAPVARARKVKRPVSSPHTTYPVETSVPPVPPVPASNPESTASTTGSGTATTDGGTAGAGQGETAKTEEKKGWSGGAKGAVIGGVVGAGAGAVINKKNPVVGAVIGGVLGAGGGYVIGRKMDKKSNP